MMGVAEGSSLFGPGGFVGRQARQILPRRKRRTSECHGAARNGASRKASSNGPVQQTPVCWCNIGAVAGGGYRVGLKWLAQIDFFVTHRDSSW